MDFDYPETQKKTNHGENLKFIAPNECRFRVEFAAAIRLGNALILVVGVFRGSQI